MIRVLAAKEMLDQLSSPKFVFLFAVSTVLILFSLYTGSSAYVGARSEFQSTEALSRRELENRKNYFELGQFGCRQPVPAHNREGRERLHRRDPSCPGEPISDGVSGGAGRPCELAHSFFASLPQRC